MIHAGSSYAADTACDPQFMDAIDARGFAEAARENAQNENLIFKPDSVLEYSCFLDHAPNPVATATLLFRDTSLEDPTVKPTKKYLEKNFYHDYLNNRYADPGKEGSGFCEIMHKVFKANRCMNFYNKINYDTLYDLTWYTRNDPRQLPMGCEALPYNGTLNMAVDIAYNNRTPVWNSRPLSAR